MTREAKHPVRTLERSLDLLAVLRERGGGRVTDVADRLPMGESAVHNHLSTLRERGYVTKEGEEYRLGLRALEIGGAVRSRRDLYRAADSVVADLARETGERAVLVTEEHDVGVYLSRATSPRSAGLVVRAGQRFALHEGAAGWALLAGLSAARRTAVLDRSGVDPETRASVASRVETVQEQGYAVGPSPVTDDRCVAVPVAVDEGRAPGALAVSASPSRRDDDWFESALVERVQDAVETVEQHLESAFLRDAWIESSTVRD